MHNDQDWKLVIFRSCIGFFGQVCDGQHYIHYENYVFFFIGLHIVYLS